MLFGYGGLRLHSDNLSYDFILPENTTELRFVDIDYRQSSFDFTLNKTCLEIVMTREGKSGMILTAVNKVYKLKLNEKLILKALSGKIMQEN